MTRIMQCSCQHPFQDQRYGSSQRVHNHTTNPIGWRCVICGKHKGEKTADKSDKSNKSDKKEEKKK